MIFHMRKGGFFVMRKGIMLVIFALLLVGCSRSAALSAEDIAAAYSGDFSCRASIACGEDLFAADITKSGGSVVFSVTEPQSMAGLSAVIDGKSAIFEFCGISAKLPFSAIPEKAPARLFFSAVTALSLPDEIYLNIEQTRAVARCDGFSAELQKEGLVPVRITFPEEETVFEIENFKFI